MQKVLPLLGFGLISATSMAQVPDLLNAFDAGGAAMAAGGGAFYQTGVDTTSNYYNPAGLAYLSGQAASLIYRNKPGSQTIASGTIPNPTLNTNGTRGSMGISHLGFTLPGGKSGKGVLALSYTIGGYISDTTIGGQNLTFNGQAISNYAKVRKAETAYYTLGYGWTTGRDKRTSFGLGLNYVQNKVAYQEAGQLADNTNVFNTNVSGTPSGVSATIGMLTTPSANSSFGISYRSEARLSGGGDAAGLDSRIPARLSAGGVFKFDVHNANYVLMGIGADHFFAANTSTAFDRKSVTQVSGGFEYNYFVGDFRVPIRIGYINAPSAGDQFGSRSGLTYGLGLHPNDKPYGLDLSYASPGTGNDFAIQLSYKF